MTQTNDAATPWTTAIVSRLPGRVGATAARVERAWTIRRHAPQRWVFVVSGGRSGSTLVQGLLNALPATLVRGENGFYLLDLFRARRRAADIKTRFGADSGPSSSAFFGVGLLDLGQFAALTRRLVLTTLLADVDPREVEVIGFKEVRWEEILKRETGDFFRFVDEAFPGALFVLNRRDPEVAIHSGHWRELAEDDARRSLARVFEIQDFLRRTRPRRTFDTSFEVITGDDAAARDAQLSGLAEFVTGDCSPETLEAMREVLTVGHGPFPFGRARGGRVVKKRPRPAARP